MSFKVGLAVVIFAASLSYRQVQAETAAVCPQIPSLLAAVDYTMRTWPNAAPADDLTYFVQMVRADQQWCAAGAQPSVLVQATLGWHFGNASEALRTYQGVAQGTPSATATVVVKPTETPAAAPTATVMPPSFSGTVADCAPPINDSITKFSGFFPGRTFILQTTGQQWQQISADEAFTTNIDTAAVTISGTTGKCLMITNRLPGKSAEVKRIK
jgi:hypothetical protein